MLLEYFSVLMNIAKPHKDFRKDGEFSKNNGEGRLLFTVSKLIEHFIIEFKTKLHLSLINGENYFKYLYFFFFTFRVSIVT